MIELGVLDNLIVGRVDPHIYAFTTNTVPNYLKVGDTYRPVGLRLQEWRAFFPDLQKEFDAIAKVDDDVYFRDFAVHDFLEQVKRRIRLQRGDIADHIYFSREFFKEATPDDIVEAIAEITCDYRERTQKYRFYNADTRLPEATTYPRTETYEPRPNQAQTIENFKNAVDAGRTNLLMYAVMRFGKSFTSMCCALEMGAKIVTVVSAKADVKEEWRKAVESHVKFADYVFLTGESLLANENIIHDTLESGQGVIVFLTLQDLQGNEIKEKHKEIFGSAIDLLIVDETHFGARAEKYGQVLRSAGYEKDVSSGTDSDDFVELSVAEEQIKVLDSRIRLHLSGTPYRILMGSEFSKEDIIAFYQFSDIAKDKAEWIKNNNALDEPQDEWENPYYGFPQMVRFAFNPNESSRRRLRELRESGVSYAFSALFKTRSIKKSPDGSHRKFIYENEILELLEVIDGSREDDELLGFLDYDKIKDGKMCRHIVCVLPYRAACDALEALICDNPDRFKNLNNYEIVNISGVDVPNAYRDPKDVKNFIRDCERRGRKTLTLTVNRMLTGSTVEEWDTMLFLKDTASPQEYDQAIFRLQNQYIRKYIDDDGHVIKYDMKPQTLLVDFEPDRLFAMQEQKSQIYNVNVDATGNTKLKDRLEEELRISPVIRVNMDKLEQVQASDILKAVSEYSKSRGVAEETNEIPVDLSLMEIEAIRIAIERENELGDKAGLTIKASDGEGTDMETPEGADGQQENRDHAGGETAEGEGQGETGTDADKKKKDPAKQFRSYYARILFFAFLTKDVVISLEDVLAKIETPDNARIARNVGISKSVLEAIHANINGFILSDLDYKIQNLNQLSHDESFPPVEQAAVAVRKFGKLGEAEVITPANICNEMIGMIPDDGLISAIEEGGKILDIASKAGEFAIAFCSRYGRLGYGIDTIREVLYAIPTSSLTYELTRKVYEVLGLNVENIASKFNAYDLLGVVDPETQKVDYEKVARILTQPVPFSEISMTDELTDTEGDERVNFAAVVGNPPYQTMTLGDANGAQAKPIYQQYVWLAKKVGSQYVSMITPARWYSGGWGLDDFRNEMISSNTVKALHDYPISLDCFSGVDIKGGICHFLIDQDYSGRCEYIRHDGKEIYPTSRFLKEDGCEVLIRFNDLISIHRKVRNAEGEAFHPFSEIVSGRSPFGLNTNHHGSNGPFPGSIPYLESTGYHYIEKNRLTKNQAAILKYKVYISKAYGAGEGWPHQIINKPIVGAPETCCSGTYLLVGPFETEAIAKNVAAYMSTKFFRILVSINKISQDAYAKVYDDVPILDFTKEWTDELLYQKYGLSESEISFIEAMIKPMERNI